MPKARIIGGTHRSRPFKTGEWAHTRATKDRVKESMFNQLMPLTRFTRVLDLFAGVGSLGFEALSRGAASVTLVESHPLTVSLLKENLQDLGLHADIYAQDAFAFLKVQNEPYDLIILDPPYQSDALEKALTLIDELNLLTHDGLIVGLHEKDITTASFRIIKHRTVGRTQITVWEKL